MYQTIILFQFHHKIRKMQPYDTSEIDYQFHYDANNPYTLVALKKLQRMSHLNSSSEAIFSNIIILPDPLLANIYKLTLKTMINQPVASQIIISEFCKLARFCYPNHTGRIKQFQCSAVQHSRMPTQMEGLYLLGEYVKQTFYHKLLNNLLRTSRDSLEAFYAHYFMQKMHKTIKNIYKDSRLKNRQFVCYRGCLLKEDELRKFKENKGRYIETLGFLSTSLSQSVALQFAVNAIFEIVVSNEPREQQFDHGYVEIDSDEKQVLFNVLCSFYILQITTASRNNVQILKVKLKYGELAHLMNAYYRKQQRNFTDHQKSIIMSVAHQQFSITNIQGQILHPRSALKFYYFETMLGLMQNCPSFDEQKKKIYEAIFIASSDLCHIRSSKVEEIINKNAVMHSTQNNKQSNLHQIVRQISNVLGKNVSYFNSEQFQTKARTILNKMLIIKPLMNFMRKDVEKGKTIRELQKQLSKQILIIRSCIDIKILARQFSYAQLINDIQQLKERVGHVFGTAHPLYTEILKTEYQYQKVHPWTPQSSQKQIQFLNRKQISSPEKFPTSYFLVKRLQRQAYLANPQNWQWELSDQKYNKKIENITNYPEALKKKVYQQLNTLLTKELQLFFSASKLSQCEKLAKRMQSNPYYMNNNYENILTTIKMHQKNAAQMYMNSLSALINSRQYQQRQYKECLVELIATKMRNIATNFGKDSEMYVAHRCFQIYNLRMLGRYEQADAKYETALDQIRGSPKERELTQFMLDALDSEY